MYTHTVELQEEGSLEIEGSADLTIRGQDEPTLIVKVPDETAFEIQQEEGKITLRLHQDARLQVGPAASISVSQLAGDLRARGLKGALDASRIEGDVILSDLGVVRLSNVEGDVIISQASDIQSQGYLDDDVTLRQVGVVELAELSGNLAVRGAASLAVEQAGDDVTASAIQGPMRLKEVRGDTTLRDVEGSVEMGRVRGDLAARDLRGDVLVTRVDGDISLHLAFRAERQYRLTGRRKITVRFPETAARFVIQAPNARYPEEGFEVESAEEGRWVVRVGEGGPDVYLTAGSEVVLGTAAADWERNVHEFGQQMAAWGEEFGQRMAVWGDQLRQRFEQTDWEHIGQEVEAATARISRLVESRLSEIDPEEISRRAQEAAKHAEARVREVDWERIAQKVERATQQGIQEGMRHAEVGLARLQKRLRQHEEHTRQQEEKARQRMERQRRRHKERMRRHEERIHRHKQRMQQQEEQDVHQMEAELRQMETEMRQMEAELQQIETQAREEEGKLHQPAPAAAPEAAAETGVAVTIELSDDEPVDEALEEERLAVLNMVEEGRLTAEEAAALLDALEGEL